MAKSIEQEIFRARGEDSELLYTIDCSLDIFRMNFVRNYKYIIAFVGMKERTLYRRLKYLGVTNPRGKLFQLKHKTRLGFDLYIVAAFCHEFGIPLSLVINFNLEEKGIDLVDYGLKKDDFIINGRTNYKMIAYLQDGNKALVSKKLRQAARDNSNNPPPVINFWREFDNLKR